MITNKFLHDQKTQLMMQKNFPHFTILLKPDNSNESIPEWGRTILGIS